MDLAVNSFNAFPVVAFLIIVLATLPILIRKSDDGEESDGDETDALALTENIAVDVDTALFVKNCIVKFLSVKF